MPAASTTAASTPARHELVHKLEEVRQLRREWLRRQIVELDRIDILASQVLGYEVRPHHLRMMQHQHQFPDGNLALVWRGAGKTTARTITRAIFRIMKNPNVRILLASKSGGNAIAMLREIKKLLESEKFVEVFGPHVGDKWDESEITVLPRTSAAKESTVTAVGIESAVASKHYDVILGDDLVDEEFARTRLMRAKAQTWFYKTLLPTLEPGGELSISGTRFHPLDLYGHLAANEFAGKRTLVVPALLGNEVDGWASQWPEKFTVEFLLGLRKSMGTILFDSQYQCSTALMAGGGVFEFDQCQRIALTEIPGLANLPRYMGVDLAISEAKTADYFVIVVIAYDSASDTVYVVDHYAGRHSFAKQRELVVEKCDEHKVARCAVEAVAYQAALLGELKRTRPDLPLSAVVPRDSKEVRAWRLSARFEGLRVFFRNDLNHLIEELVSFPDAEHDDGFDALEYAVRAVHVRARRERREPGLL